MSKQITKAQEDYILANWDKLTPAELVRDTGCSLPTVKAKVKILKEAVKEEEKPVQPVKKEQTMMMKQFGRVRKDSSKPVQATVMTPGASELADDTRKMNKPKKDQPHIHRPFGE